VGKFKPLCSVLALCLSILFAGPSIAQEQYANVRGQVVDTDGQMPSPSYPPFSVRRLFESGQGYGREKGLGLGLSIVKAIAEVHGGGIRVSTANGGGICFDIFLPTRPPAKFSKVFGDPVVQRKY
jgi:K+-sensing histidine kinase KdpD